MHDSRRQVTISELALPAEVQEETRAELCRLALRAHEHWLELESKVEQLEDRWELARRPSVPTAGGSAAITSVDEPTSVRK